MSRPELDGLIRHVRVALPPPWPEWPGGWPGEAEAALLDSVFSIRARYGTESTGVRAVVSRWREHRGEALDDLTHLAGSNGPPGTLHSVLANDQVLSGAGTKAHGCAQAAAALVEIGVRHSRDLTGSDAERHAWCAVKGLGEVSWSYFLMLLGTTGVKADIMVRRFVSEAIGRWPSATEARDLVLATAVELAVDATQLDHAVWRHQRAR